MIEWYGRSHRDLPWRGTSDPYRIWISEVMLQQTRAQAVIPYYERFLRRFPTIDALAGAAENDVLALWSGLGYYSRARNLLKAARLINQQGGFPMKYEGIRSLPGVGDYTAAAIASIAYGLPYAVVDGNVLRVIARVENDSAEIGSSRTRERFRAIAQTWLDRERAGDFNQAIMELGATVCLPAAPLCANCPIRRHCRGYQAGNAAALPVKLRKAEFVQIEESLLWIERRGRVLLKREEDSAIRMAGFWRLPTILDLPRARCLEPVGDLRHTITRHKYKMRVHRAELGAHLRPSRPGFGWFTQAQLQGIPLSTIARKALRLAKRAQ